jgi:hypothetical protein
MPSVEIGRRLHQSFLLDPDRILTGPGKNSEELAFLLGQQPETGSEDGDRNHLGDVSSVKLLWVMQGHRVSRERFQREGVGSYLQWLEGVCQDYGKEGREVREVNSFQGHQEGFLS